jgi:hypothetical protein
MRQHSNFRKLALLISSVVQLTVVCYASEESGRWQGYLIDRECARSIKSSKENPRLALQKHPKACAIKAKCREQGYCLFIDGHWADLNAIGNALAAKLLKGSKRKYGCFVEVAGVLKIEPVQAIEAGQSTVTVTTISEKWSIQAEEMQEKIEPPSKWSI